MQPLPMDLPDAYETTRLVVRVPRVGDGKSVHAGIVESLDALHQWPESLPWAQTEPSEEGSEIFCRTAAAAFACRSDISMLMFLRESQQFVGCLSLHPGNLSVPSFKIGYWCRSSLQRQALTLEAVVGACGYARSRLRAQRLEIRCIRENMASRKVAERAGFTLEAILSNDCATPAGVPRDTCIYALVT